MDKTAQPIYNIISGRIFFQYLPMDKTIAGTGEDRNFI